MDIATLLATAEVYWHAQIGPLTLETWAQLATISGFIIYVVRTFFGSGKNDDGCPL